MAFTAEQADKISKKKPARSPVPAVQVQLGSIGVVLAKVQAVCAPLEFSHPILHV